MGCGQQSALLMQQRKAAPRQLLGAPGGHSTLSFLFTDLTPSAVTAWRGHLFSNHLRQDCSFWEVAHVCALTSQAGKAGAAGAGNPSGEHTRVCCQHECAICPLCTAVERLHVLQPHLQVHCRHILTVITGGRSCGRFVLDL